MPELQGKNQGGQMSAKYWICKCGYVLPGAQYLQAALDYGCPRCGASYATFHPSDRPSLSDDDNDDEQAGGTSANGTAGR
jgi:predicted  nucleic acid-binding Zn-ribbon protein